MTSPAVRGRMLKIRTGELIERIGKLEAAADFCRTGKTALAQYASLAPADADRFAPIDVIRDLEAVVGDPIVTRHLAVEAGAAVVMVPASVAAGADLLTLLASQSRESSELTTALCLGLADGRLCAAEARKAREEVRQLVAVAMQMDAELALIVGEDA
ncbi:hypothetical protein [Sphingomonas sp. Leaf10]|uniref:hypothetical protein n=1 Tax=Sphingomonas sp. Leaf10 TaxID=1735676 RepID=UPI000B11EF32|nr:hypothetical protein [Sphingomonas sp. Leaf10]